MTFTTSAFKHVKMHGTDPVCPLTGVVHKMCLSVITTKVKSYSKFTKDVMCDMKEYKTSFPFEVLNVCKITSYKSLSESKEKGKCIFYLVHRKMS